MNPNISTLEILPNELLIEIFEYICTYTLFHIFSRLNSRFSSLIHLLPHLHYVLEEDWDHSSTKSIPFFSTYVTSLTVKHDETIDFSSFPRIRSLKLCRPTLEQCNAIQPHLLPHLEHLYISNFYSTDRTEQLCRFVFSPLFPSLRTCQMDRMTFVNFHFNPSLSIQQLTISPCTWKSNLFTQIFHTCPHLTILRIVHFANISFPFTPHSIPAYTSIRYLSISFDSIDNETWFDHLDSILSFVPNLETFHLSIDLHQSNVNFPFPPFFHMLIQRVPHLISFKAKLPSSKMSPINLNVIQPLYPLHLHLKLKQHPTDHSQTYLLISSQN